VGDATDDLARLWQWFAEHQFRGDSPVYERIARAVARDRELLDLLMQAPTEAHLPLAPLAAARYLLLDGLDHPLSDVYSGRSDADPGPLFLELCRAERDKVLSLLATRRVQTNECGRSALIAPALTWVARRLAGPYCLVDVGTSAGLNLLCDRYRLSYGRFGATGPADSPVSIRCEVTGSAPPIAASLPPFERRLGIDPSPIDLSDPSDVRWLRACVWPDTDRTGRLEASILLAQHEPPTIVAGRAGDVLPSALAALPLPGTAIVVTTSTFGYFSTEERVHFDELLAAESRRRQIAWISAEARGTVAALAPVDEGEPGDVGVLGVVSFDGGRRSVHDLARVHPHGNWMEWHGPP
jgi:hypothetical protein